MEIKQTIAETTSTKYIGTNYEQPNLQSCEIASCPCQWQLRVVHVNVCFSLQAHTEPAQQGK